MINIYSLDHNNVLTIGNVLNTPFHKAKDLYMEQGGQWFQFKDRDDENNIFRELVPVGPSVELLLKLKANEIKKISNWEEALAKNPKEKKKEELQ